MDWTCYWGFLNALVQLSDAAQILHRIQLYIIGSSGQHPIILSFYLEIKMYLVGYSDFVLLSLAGVSWSIGHFQLLNEQTWIGSPHLQCVGWFAEFKWKRAMHMPSLQLPICVTSLHNLCRMVYLPTNLFFRLVSVSFFITVGGSPTRIPCFSHYF